MKQLSFFLMGVLAMLVASCGFKSTETEISDNLLSYTVPGAAKGEVWLGVKDKSGKVLIAPADYQSITVDENIILCTKADKTFAVFGLSGEDYGTYNECVKTTVPEAEPFFEAFVGEEKSYIFPTAGTVLHHVKADYCTQTAIFVTTDSLWTVYAKNGEKLWDLPQGAVLIENQTETIVAVPGKGRTPACKLYDIQGQLKESLTASKWKKFKKRLIIQQTFENLHIYQPLSLNVQQNIPSYTLHDLVKPCKYIA